MLEMQVEISTCLESEVFNVDTCFSVLKGSFYKLRKFSRFFL